MYPGGWKWVGWPNDLSHFLMSETDLFYKLNWPRLLIDQMFIRTWHWYLVSELTLGLLKVNYVLNHNYCKTSLLLQAVLKHVMSRDFILKMMDVCIWNQFCIFSRATKSMALFHFTMSLCIIVKKRTSACRPHEGLIWITLRVNESIGVTHFQCWFDTL